MVLANEKNEVWLAMELLDGSLDTFLHNNQYEIPFDTQIKILLDAANGMEHVAGKGFVHRDLACRNIIYSVDNAGWFSNFLRQVLERIRLWLDESSNLRYFIIPTSQMIRAHWI